MFRKILSNIAFSPALVEQLSDYAKQIQSETSLRRIGVVFVILAVIIQVFIALRPPESANTASETDFIPGGISQNDGPEGLVAAYDGDINSFGSLLRNLGVTRQELSQARYGTVVVADQTIWGLAPLLGSGAGEQTVTTGSAANHSEKHYFIRPVKALTDQVEINAWIGQSAQLGSFSITAKSGSILTQPAQHPCAATATASVTCLTGIKESKAAQNLTQGVVAVNTTAKAGDRIGYTIEAKNTTNELRTVSLQEYLGDVMEYTTVIDTGGGILDANQKTLTWPSVRIKPGDTATRTFAVEVLGVIPATARGASNNASYDCALTNVFGTRNTIPLSCPLPKTVETISQQLPTTSLITQGIFGGTLLIVSTFFYLRARQIKKEVRILRHTVNTGAL